MAFDAVVGRKTTDLENESLGETGKKKLRLEKISPGLYEHATGVCNGWTLWPLYLRCTIAYEGGLHLFPFLFSIPCKTTSQLFSRFFFIVITHCQAFGDGSLGMHNALRRIGNATILISLFLFLPRRI